MANLFAGAPIVYWAIGALGFISGPRWEAYMSHCAQWSKESSISIITSITASPAKIFTTSMHQLHNWTYQLKGTWELTRLCIYRSSTGPMYTKMWRIDARSTLATLSAQQEFRSSQRRLREAVTSWPSPSSPTELWSFLGLCSYYRRFFHRFADTAMPPYRLLEKRQCFEWTPEAEEVFQLLKQKLTLTPIPSWTTLFLIPHSSVTQMRVALYCVIGRNTPLSAERDYTSL